MSFHPYATHTRCSTKFHGCTFQRSLDDWPTCVLLAGLHIRSYTSRARLDVQRHCTVCERFPACRHAVVAQIHEVTNRVRSIFDRNPIDRHTADMLSATLGREQRCRSLNPSIIGFQKPFHRVHVSLASWEPIVPSSSSDLQPHVQPIIDEPIINGAMQEILQLSDIEQLCEYVTHSEKHTPDEKDHLHLRIHHDVLNPRSITTF